MHKSYNSSLSVLSLADGTMFSRTVKRSTGLAINPILVGKGSDSRMYLILY